MNRLGFYKLGIKIKGTRLTPREIISFKYGRGGIWYKCDCDCGKSVEPSPHAIKTGTIKSCGCYKIDLAKAKTTHGLSKRPEYFAAMQAFSRCTNKADSAYKNYGARGIRCQFKSGSDMAVWIVNNLPKPAGKFMLDRINNEGHYTKGNLRWSTSKESSNNRRCTQRVTILGITKPIHDWSREAGVGVMTIRGRIKAKFPQELWLYKGRITKAVLFALMNNTPK